MNQEVIKVLQLNGQQFKDWTHKMTAKAVQNGSAKTQTVLLKNIYNIIYDNNDLNVLMRGYLLFCKNHLDFLANGEPDKKYIIDFILLKAEFISLILEKVGENK